MRSTEKQLLIDSSRIIVRVEDFDLPDTVVFAFNFDWAVDDRAVRIDQAIELEVITRERHPRGRTVEIAQFLNCHRELIELCH